MGSQETSGNQAALQNANTAWNTYNNDYGQWQNQYTQYRNQADNAFNQGIQTANEQLRHGAQGATAQAQLAGRQAGLTKGQAAMNAAGASNNMFQNNYAGTVNNATQARLGAAQQQQANAMQGMGMASGGMQGAMGVQQGVGANQKSEFDKNMGIVSGVGQAAGSAKMMFSDAYAKEEIDPVMKDGFLKRLASLSDERIKEEIPSDNDMIAEVAEMINNYTYHYKPGTGENPSVEYSGPMAQELLQVDGYRSCVFEDENGFLKVDTGRLALVNAGMISDLSKRLLMLEDFIKSVVGGFQQPIADVE